MYDELFNTAASRAIATAPQDDQSPLVSVVIPVYNAQKTIEPLCRELLATVGALHRLEIVLVNDASLDNSREICLGLQAEFDSQITFLDLSRNFGEHNAVMAGLNYTRGDYVIVMDDDLQNPPAEVLKLVAEVKKGCDVVYCQYIKKRDSAWRNLGSRINDHMARIVLRKKASLYLSSFKAMNRFLVNEVIKYKGPDPYLDAIILRVTSSIGSVKVKHEKRRAGKSNYTFRKLLGLWGNMVVSFSLIPLRIIGLLGLVLTVNGLFHGGRILLAIFHPEMDNPNDLERLTAATLFFRGFQLLATSVVGEYVGRNYLHLHRDPQYAVREVRRAGEKRAERARARAEAGA